MIKKTLRLFFVSKTFVISISIVLIYAIFFHNQIIFNDTNLTYIFYFLLALLPLVLSVFAILISFTDTDFLKFLKDNKIADNRTSIYDAIVFYFKLNTIWMISSLLYVSIILWFNIYDFKLISIPIFQYFAFFMIAYTIVSFIQVVFFIFYFANKKAEFVEGA